jgi:hypothetical protein
VQQAKPEVSADGTVLFRTEPGPVTPSDRNTVSRNECRDGLRIGLYCRFSSRCEGSRIFNWIGRELWSAPLSTASVSGVEPDGTRTTVVRADRLADALGSLGKQGYSLRVRRRRMA